MQINKLDFMICEIQFFVAKSEVFIAVILRQRYRNNRINIMITNMLRTLTIIMCK